MRYPVQLFLSAVMLTGLAGCSQEEELTSLNISAADYAGQGIGGYSVVDPNDPKNRGGGESLAPYSAGGITCCYQIPKQWHEGLQVDVVVSYPLEGDTTDERSESLARRQAEGTLHQTIRVDVPEYQTPAKGTLWVQFMPDEKANVVVSNFDPPHEDFPGEVKGWPVPSDEYRRKLVDRELADIESRLERNQKNLAEFKDSPGKSLERFWGVFTRTRSERVEGLSGPQDPKFKPLLEEYLTNFIKHDQRRIELLREARP
ncbi:DUF3304 domain-containing protein [Marinobacterium mangrovicola]|uniref:Uncharacterized protein DUF3304 n=1 Tax=Marinobacterium mangrovicola TaxID=1476959 RepID=A0A4R1GJI4_9GAMM|nr:DUF3304 domain-containing protein [Marinobacterium mangrovicola]TCK08547.1 uncharacterized protein DUF3304 [Marinobacterium mangrovicola]